MKRKFVLTLIAVAAGVALGYWLNRPAPRPAEKKPAAPAASPPKP